MKISELINQLRTMRNKHGDVDVVYFDRAKAERRGEADASENVELIEFMQKDPSYNKPTVQLV